jgi:hypothetical protein
MDQFENNLWSAPAKANKLRLFVLGQLQLRPRRQHRSTAMASWPGGGTMESTKIGQTHPFQALTSSSL